jgi:ankyrin repeat protein
MQAKIPVPQNSVEIPDDIICPITSHIMTDPVMLVESGNTYEREAIFAWLKTKKSDPLTNEVISNPTIAPNHMAKKLIASFLEKQRAIHPHIVQETYLPASLVQTLITALEKNEINLFKETLKKDYRLLFNELKEHKTIFMLACEFGSLEILEVVVSALGEKIKSLKCVETDQGLSVFLMVGHRLGLKGGGCIAKAMDWKASDFQALLISSVEKNDSAMVGILLSLGAVGTLELLNQAYVEKKTAIVKILIFSGVSIENEDEKGNDFFMRTIEDGYTALTLHLLSQCADKLNPYKLNRANGSAWLMAVEKKQLHVVKELLNHSKTQLNQVNAQKETALHLAVKNQDAEVVKLLIDKKISFDAKNVQGRIALDIAYELYDKKDFLVLKLLILSSTQIGDLLLKAIEKHQEELIEFLLTDAKALFNPHLSDARGQTALMLAVQKNQLKTITLLLKQPIINVHVVDSEGYTALHHAAMRGSNEIVKLLMKQDASAKAKNTAGKTSIELARQRGHNDLANWMEEKHRYKKVKPFLKPLQVKLEEQSEQVKNAEEKITSLTQENQELRETLKALTVNLATQNLRVEKLSIFSENYAQSLMGVAEREQQQRSGIGVVHAKAVKSRRQEMQEAQKKTIIASENSSRSFSNHQNNRNPSIYQTNTVANARSEIISRGMPRQKGFQTQLMAVLLKGDLESVKKLELQGASLFYPNEAGVYPLVVAVYSTNLELVRYVEEKLKDQASIQWGAVDSLMAKKKIAAAMPREFTASDCSFPKLGHFYETHKESGWKWTYDSECLRREPHNAQKKAKETFLDRAARMYKIMDLIRLSDSTGISFANDFSQDSVCSLMAETWPTTSVHVQVVKMIRNQLEELKKDVETKIKQSPTTPMFSQ